MLLTLKREQKSSAKRWMMLLEAGKTRGTDYPMESSKATLCSLGVSLGFISLGETISEL